MSFYSRGVEKRRLSLSSSIKEEDMTENMTSASMEDQDIGYDSGSGKLDQEKRMRREIANSNERRRMQSINAGFQSLKTLLPHQDGEKLSKAAILHQTAEYISNLERQNSKLSAENSQLKRLHGGSGAELETKSQNSPPPKRKKRDTESSDEGIGIDDANAEEVKREVLELKSQLNHERRLRMILEDQSRDLEARVYPESLRRIAHVVETEVKRQDEKKCLHSERRRLDHPKPSSTSTQAEPHQPPFVQNSMSKRNLETIVEAIRHLEGDNVLLDGSHRYDESKDAANSDENSSMDEVEHDDWKSDTSESPMSGGESSDSYYDQPKRPAMNAEKYPIAMQLLHRPPTYPVQVLPVVSRSVTQCS